MSKMWCDLDASEKEQFRCEYGELQGAALKEALEVTMVQKTIHERNLSAGTAAEFLPLNV